MPTPVDPYQALVSQYNQLPWYKKKGFWLSAPRLAWELLGRIKQLIQWPPAPWFFKTKFEQDICSIVEPVNSSNYNKPPPNTNFTPLGECADVIGVIAEYGVGNAYAGTSRFHREADKTRKLKITNQLLLAVAYGMESQEANVPVKASDAGNLFKSHLYAKELLHKSPEFLLERGDVTDWAGRTFKNITAFEYALWAKDFKMIEMMLHCIPETEEGETIRAALLKQYKQVTAPIYDGGGLTYTYTYYRPTFDASGILNGTTTSITEVHTENHFDITPLCDAYRDHGSDYKKRSWPDKLLSKQQRLLPIHILQRYCDPNTPFNPPPKYNGEFKRSTNFRNFVTQVSASLLGFSQADNFVLPGWVGGELGPGTLEQTLWALRTLDKVSTNEIENIARKLSPPQHDAGLHP